MTKELAKLKANKSRAYRAFHSENQGPPHSRALALWDEYQAADKAFRECVRKEQGVSE